MRRAKVITSAANPLLKDVRRAVARGSLTAEGYCIAESFHLLQEALRSRCELGAVLVSESAAGDLAARLPEVRATVVAERMFQELATTESSQGVIALVRPKEWSVDQLFGTRPLVIVLDALQDPGNAGAVVRAAEAFGATGVMFVKGTASPFHPKTLRASAGSLWRVPFVHGMDSAQTRAALEPCRLDLYAAVSAPAGGAQSLMDANLRRGCALIMGNEARGVSKQLRTAARDLFIPTTGVESLNASVAAGILLYEAWRQRSRKS